MTAAPRRVRRLTVRAASETIARRVAIQLEDALRTASLPGADSAQVVLIRSLRLRRVSAAVSPLQLAVAIEQRLWQLGSSAVHALDPAAAGADVVYFADAAEAHIELALRLASSAVPREWFWRAAVPEWNPAHSRDEALLGILESIARLEGAPVVAAGLVQALAQAGVADVLCGALRGDRAERWTAALGAAPARTAMPPQVAASLVPLLKRWVAAWGSTDPRSAWLAAVALVAARPERAGDPALRASARSVARHFAAAATNLDAEGEQPALPRPDEGCRPDARRTWDHAPAHVPRASAGDGTLARDEAVHPDINRAPAGADDHADDPGPGTRGHSSPARHDWHVTRSGGLLFLLQPVRHLGIASTLAADPGLPEDLATRILASVASRLRMPADDPLWALLQHDVTSASTAGHYAVHVWVLALRRWCRRHAGMTLRDVVERTAAVRWTDTHVDVRFNSQSMDVRIRRAGLDLDPGWVPWIRRAVRFHYFAGRLNG